MYPNNIFIYKNGAVRTDNHIYPKYLTHLEEYHIGRYEFKDAVDLAPVDFQIVVTADDDNGIDFYRFSLPHIEVWIEK